MLESKSPMAKCAKIFTIGIYIFAITAVVVPIVFFCKHFVSSSSEDFWPAVSVDLTETEKTTSKPLLSTHSNHELMPKGRSVWIPHPQIHDQLIFINNNSRPDLDQYDKTILLGMKNCDNIVGVSPNEKLYFKCSDSERLIFSDTPTPYWAEITDVGNNLEVMWFVQYKNHSGDVMHENSEKFFLEKTPSNNCKTSTALTEIQNSLSPAKLYLPDCVMGIYGGKLFEKEKESHRLNLNPEKNNLLFIKNGDLLSFNNGIWEKDGCDTHLKPLLRIEEITTKECTCSLWSADGLESKRVTIPVNNAGPIMSKGHEIFTKIYQRNNNSVMCNICGKNMIFREGDWILKHKYGWRKINTLSELKDYLIYSLKGELFIFDGIEKRDGCSYFTGHLFDENRTCSQRVEILMKNTLSTKGTKNTKGSVKGSGQDKEL